MNVGDSIRNSNSWHWLCVAVVAAAAASVFLPTYGWRDVLQFAGRQLAADEERAQKRLDDTRTLAAVDVKAVAREREKAKAAMMAAKDAFATYGFEGMPTDDKAVFSAQSRVNEALSRHRLRVVSTEAKVVETPAAAKPATRKAPVRSASKKPQTPEEYLANAERAAAAMKDKQVAEMILADARKKATQMKEAEKKTGKATGMPLPRNATTRGSSTLTASSPVPVPLPFKTETLEYRVAGDFRDVFMFFVAETHRKPYYNFKDISASVGENGMDLAFTLQVNHR